MEADVVHPGDLDVPDVTLACPDLSTVCRLDERGLEVTGQRLEPDRAVLLPCRWSRPVVVSPVRL